MKLIKYTFEFIIIILLFLIFKIVGIKISRNVSSFIFKNFGSFFRSKKTSRANLSIAFPNFNEMQKDKILANMWINYGKIFAEYMFIKKFRISKKFSNQMIIENQDELENPLLRSGIVLAGANQPDLNPYDDGYLTALEVTKLDLEGTELAVISGCESGKGDFQSGEGVYGLKRALAVAGSRSSLLSLWKVDDYGTALFMESFYEKLKEGKSRSKALSDTQKEFREHPLPGFRHPGIWAAFVLSGDWRQIKF